MKSRRRSTAMKSRLKKPRVLKNNEVVEETPIKSIRRKKRNDEISEKKRI